MYFTTSYTALNLRQQGVKLILLFLAFLLLFAKFKVVSSGGANYLKLQYYFNNNFLLDLFSYLLQSNIRLHFYKLAQNQIHKLYLSNRQLVRNLITH